VAVLLTLKLPGLVATTQEATPTAIGDGMPQAYHGVDKVPEVGEQERFTHRRMERKTAGESSGTPLLPAATDIAACDVWHRAIPGSHPDGKKIGPHASGIAAQIIPGEIRKRRKARVGFPALQGWVRS
ncbi:MAG TPA: hypothetical protein VEW66_01295, partial [Thermomicrobiales bacterium]|nr:hypothetical protein [Thermomicrobiales bacterium]